MEHISQTEWLEYLAGTLQADRKAWIDNHVKECQACRTVLEQTDSFNDILGQWTVDVSGHDIADRVTQAVCSECLTSRIPAKDSLRHRFWSNAWRIAATVLVGVFLGYMAGKSSAKQLIAKQEGKVSEIEPTYLAGLDLQFAGGLIWSVLEDDSADPEGGQ